MGGGTTKVGDPSGRDETRQLLTDEQIAANIAGIREIFSRFLTFGDGPTDAVMANNDDWLGTLQYIPFLREIGRHFTINRMLTMDSVQLRLEREQPLTFLEFNYMILQGYDFVELQQALRLPPADGRLRPVGQHRAGRRARTARARRAAVRPHLAADHDRLRRQDGQDRERRRVAEPRAPVALRVLAVLAQYRGCRRRPVPAPVHRAAAGRDRRLEQLPGAQINDAKKMLATEATRMCHGERRPGTPWPPRSAPSRAPPRRACPTSRSRPTEPALLIEVIVSLGTGAPPSSEARRLMEQGGIRLNDTPIRSATATVARG